MIVRRLSFCNSCANPLVRSVRAVRGASATSASISGPSIKAEAEVIDAPRTCHEPEQKIDISSKIKKDRHACRAVE